MLRVKLYTRTDGGERYRGEILGTPSAINGLYEGLRGECNPFLYQEPREKFLRLIFTEVERHGKKEAT